MSATVPTIEEFDALAARVTALENAEPPPEPEPEPEPESLSPASFVTEQQLEDIKERIAADPGGIHARLYADMLANGKPNGGGWRTSETRLLYADPGYTAACASVVDERIEFSYPGTFPHEFGHDAYGQNFTDDCTAMLTLAIRSRLDADPAVAEECAVAAINCLDVWVTKLAYVDHQWDNNLATGKLWWAWGWQQLGPALTLLWEHPTFDDELKADLAEWCWVVGMDKSATARSQGIVYDPDDGHWIRSRTYKSTATPPANSGITNEDTPSAGVTGEGNLLCEVGGSNHTLTYWMARLHHGLVIGGDRGLEIVEAVMDDFRNLIRSVIYYTGDAHHILGPGWPCSAQPPGYPKPSAYDSAKDMAEYWFEEESKWTPFDGIGQEMGRDRGHHRMSNYAIHAICATLTNAGFGDWFSTEDSGVPNWAERMVATEEFDSGTFLEVIEVADRNFGGDIGGALSNSAWTPEGVYTGRNWAADNMGTNGGVTGGFANRPPTWTCGGTSADRGTHLADYFLRYQRGHHMPLTEELARLLGDGGGVGPIRAGNQFTWEALLFTPV